MVKNTQLLALFLCISMIFVLSCSDDKKSKSKDEPDKTTDTGDDTGNDTGDDTGNEDPTDTGTNDENPNDTTIETVCQEVIDHGIENCGLSEQQAQIGLAMCTGADLNLAETIILAECLREVDCEVYDDQIAATTAFTTCVAHAKGEEVEEPTASTALVIAFCKYELGCDEEDYTDFELLLCVTTFSEEFEEDLAAIDENDLESRLVNCFPEEPTCSEEEDSEVFYCVIS